jgi:hypothetical protein
MLARTDGYFAERGRWYFRNHGNVMGPFADKAEAQMAVLYFRQRLKWPSQRQLHQFMERSATQSPDCHPADGSPNAMNAGFRHPGERA